MDFTIFDTGGDPNSPGPKEPKAPERGGAGDESTRGRQPQGRFPPQQRAERSKAVAPVRPGANEPTHPRFPRGYLVTVCTLIIQNEDAEAGRLLANLFRALHLDQTTFSFASLDRLGPANREHAEKLISAKLAGAYTPTEWDRAFRLIEDYADPVERREIGGGGNDSDAMMLAALRETYAPKPPPNPQTPPAKPREAQPERRPPQTFTRPPNIADAKVEGFERTRPAQTPNVANAKAEGFERGRPPQALAQPSTIPDAKGGFERGRPPQALAQPSTIPDAKGGFERGRPPQALAQPLNVPDAKVEGFEPAPPAHTQNVPDGKGGFERNRPPQVEKPAPRPSTAVPPRPLPVDKDRQGSPSRTLPPIDFPLSETAGFTRTRPPEHFSADSAESERAEPHEPPQFSISSDSLWQTDAGSRRAGSDDRGGDATGLPARREPIINLDAPLPPDNRSDHQDVDRSGHDKLMYALLAIIVAAALAFVGVNYSLFYKPAPVTGKPGPAGGPAPATRVVADPAALSERVPLLPVSRQANPPPPPRGMAIAAETSVNPPAAAKSAARASPSSVKR